MSVPILFGTQSSTSPARRRRETQREVEALISGMQSTETSMVIAGYLAVKSVQIFEGARQGCVSAAGANPMTQMFAADTMAMLGSDLHRMRRGY